jgi:hypothetical protein
VRRVFNHVSLCFCDWESASAIVEARVACRAAALASFRNPAKLDAIVTIAQDVNRRSFAAIKTAMQSNPIGELRRLPYIGPVTVWHLAKNLGLDVAKPDRHLVRLSSCFGFRSTAQLCAALSEITGEQIKVVDLILWRYLADISGESHNTFAGKDHQSLQEIGRELPSICTKFRGGRLPIHENESTAASN